MIKRNQTGGWTHLRTFKSLDDLALPMSDLNRFLKAQERSYDTALEEIRAACKTSHWIWYVFPQLKGLGMSQMSEFYGIDGRDEAVAYIRHPVLGRRLVEISTALLNCGCSDPSVVLGFPDDLKVRSCMTLFEAVCPEERVFSQVLDNMYEGARDQKTLELLRN